MGITFKGFLFINIQRLIIKVIKFQELKPSFKDNLKKNEK